LTETAPDTGEQNVQRAYARLGKNAEQVADLCRKLGVQRLALFGSILTDHFNAESDVDLLVEFLPGVVRSLFDKGGIQMDFEDFFGRKVDLAELRLIDNLTIRKEILAHHQEIYAA
jgi:predicted nucleotidyltransferase